MMRNHLAMCVATILAAGAAVAADLRDESVSLTIFPNLPGIDCSTASLGIPDDCSDIEAGELSWCCNLIPLVVSDLDRYPEGIGGLQFGIEYSPDLQVFWTLCNGGSEIPSPSWPQSGSGNALTFPGGCVRPGVENLFVGYFSVNEWSDESFIRLTPDPRIGGDALIASCAPEGALSGICPSHLAGGLLDGGLKPVCGTTCGGVPVAESSWSNVKSLYRGDRSEGD